MAAAGILKEQLSLSADALGSGMPLPARSSCLLCLTQFANWGCPIHGVLQGMVCSHDGSLDPCKLARWLTRPSKERLQCWSWLKRPLVRLARFSSVSTAPTVECRAVCGRCKPGKGSPLQTTLLCKSWVGDSYALVEGIWCGVLVERSMWKGGAK
jgi:hypothetical protein